MSHFFSLLLAVCVTATTVTSASFAQDTRAFTDRAVLDAEIATYMAEARFSDLVESVAPPSLMSLGRIRNLEQAYSGRLPSLRQSQIMFRTGSPDAISRDLTVWWEGDDILFLGLLTHARPDNLVVLDFLLTNDVRRASRWYLGGDTQ
jgi:hypothetical protein